MYLYCNIHFYINISIVYTYGGANIKIIDSYMEEDHRQPFVKTDSYVDSAKYEGWTCQVHLVVFYAVKLDEHLKYQECSYNFIFNPWLEICMHIIYNQFAVFIHNGMKTMFIISKILQ